MTPLLLLLVLLPAVPVPVAVPTTTPVEVAPASSEPTPSVAPSAPPVGTANKLERVAVYDFTVAEVEERVGRIVTDSVVAELRKLDGLSVVSMDEVRAMLAHESNKALLGCSEASCVSEIADALGVDTIVVGSLAVVGTESVIGVRRLNQQSASAVGQATRRLEPQDGEEYLAAVGPIVEELFPDMLLRAGQKRGVDEKVALLVNPPPLPVWSTLVVAGAALALTAGGAVAATGLGLTQEEFHSLAELSLKQDVPGQELVDARDRGQVLALTTNGLLAGALVAGVAAGVMVPWTNWTGAGDE